MDSATQDRQVTIRSRRGGLWRAWPIGVLILLAAAFWMSGASKYLSFQQLVVSRAALVAFVSAHFAIALAAYGLAYFCLALFSVPGGLLMTMSGGFLFGPWIGAPVTVLSATAGASMLFLVARSSLGEMLRARAGPRINRLRAGFAEDAVSYMLFLRLTPLFPFPLVNLAPALLGVKFSTFVWTTFVGIMPGALAYSMAGAGLDSVMGAQETVYNACLASGQAGCQLQIWPSQLVTRELVFALAALGLVALIPVAIKRFRVGRFAAPASNPETPAP